MADARARPRLLKSKFFWVGVLYFAEGFPLGVFFDVFPVYFRQQGVDLRDIGVISLLGLAWTFKFLWAPAVDYYRHHRIWMAAVDLAMGAIMLVFATVSGLGPWVWLAIAAFTLFSATNDIAIDGYTIEMLDKNELGIANGIRIGLYRVGMLAAGGVLILSDFIAWSGAFVCAALTLAGCAALSLAAPREQPIPRAVTLPLAAELRAIVLQPRALALVLLFALGCVWIANSVMRWSLYQPNFWTVAWGIALAVFAILTGARLVALPTAPAVATTPDQGPLFGALMELLERPGILPVLVFILIFKLADASMGFMVKPFWVDSGFTATEIGLVSVNIGLALSILGGLAGGWYTDRAGIFRALWVLGLFQAFSNLGYALAAAVIPAAATGASLELQHRTLIYAASGIESFTGGLGTAAFLAFLMAIVNKQRSATEYALLSSLFALSRSFAGWASGFGAQEMGYAGYFLLTFFLAFPAYLFLPWAKRMLAFADQQAVAPNQGAKP